MKKLQSIIEKGRLMLHILAKRKEHKAGDGITPKGVDHSIVPSQWLNEWKENELASVYSKKIIVIH